MEFGYLFFGHAASYFFMIDLIKAEWNELELLNDGWVTFNSTTVENVLHAAQ